MSRYISFRNILCLGLLLGGITLFSSCATANCSTCNTCPNTAHMAGYN